MDDVDKVLKGLKCCSDAGGKHCYEGKCPYASMSEPCREKLANDAMYVIEQLRAENETLKSVVKNGNGFIERCDSRTAQMFSH